MIKIITVENKQSLLNFVKFPFILYKNNPYWVPPLIEEELNALDLQKNPLAHKGYMRLFLAIKNNAVVGRVAALMNWIEIKQEQKKKLRFGWYDTIDDIEVSQKLLEAVTQFGLRNQLTHVEGPMGFSNMDKAGVLCEGFNELPTMITWYHHPYQHQHLEKLGWTKQAEWIEHELQIFSAEEAPKRIEKFSKIIADRYGLKVLKFKNKTDLLPRVNEMFDLLNSTYAELQTFVPIQQQQVNHYKEKYFKFIHIDFIKCVANASGKMIGFAISMPSFSKALQKANGSLWPTGWWHLWRALKHNDRASLYLIGVDPKYRGKGITALLFQEMQKSFNVHGIQKVETNPELVENTAIQALWKHYPTRQHKRRCTYRKTL